MEEEWKGRTRGGAERPSARREYARDVLVHIFLVGAIRQGLSFHVAVLKPKAHTGKRPGTQALEETQQAQHVKSNRPPTEFEAELEEWLSPDSDDTQHCQGAWQWAVVVLYAH